MCTDTWAAICGVCCDAVCHMPVIVIVKEILVVIMIMIRKG